jgi:NAD(P)-dependent dehydrogenase (short-subunit alcohol dehydrogenase family)
MKIQEKFDLTNRVAIVTGGGGQLGTEFCKTLAEAGAAVVAADLLMDHADRTAKLLSDSAVLTSSSTAPRSIQSSIPTRQLWVLPPARLKIIRLNSGTRP